MNTDKWDRVAATFEHPEYEPPNGWASWEYLASQEAATIRRALPLEVETIVEIGSGVGRLTPYLALCFIYVTATDTSAACRRVTRQRCAHRPNVKVREQGFPLADAAVVWGRLYDDDWPELAVMFHRRELRREYAFVLEGAESAWHLYSQ
jgi:SAM-dependent methyltransferase